MTAGRRAETVAAAAQRWCEAWNQRDLDAVMAHYADDVEFSSPTVVKRWNIEIGWLIGKEKLRAHFEIGMRSPTLRFGLVDVLHGAAGTYCVLYRRETGALVTDLVEADADGLARRVVACYGI